MLSTAPQPAAATKSKEILDPQQFLNWKGKELLERCCLMCWKRIHIRRHLYSQALSLTSKTAQILGLIVVHSVLLPDVGEVINVHILLLDSTDLLDQMTM